MLRFKLNWNKAVEAVVWLANRQPDITFFYVSKMLYYADKWHLERYARPITGDIYIAMNDGPVPSGIYDLVREERFAPIEAIAQLNDAVEIKAHSISPKRAIVDGILSGSDVRLLEEAYCELSCLEFDELSNRTHDEPAWINAQLNGEMDFHDIVSKHLNNRDALIEEIKEKARYGVP